MAAAATPRRATSAATPAPGCPCGRPCRGARGSVAGIGLGCPVERSLQFSGLVTRGGNSHGGHSPNLSLHVTHERSSGVPSPRVTLSRGLKRYYGRLRLPPGSPVVSRSAVIDQPRSGALRRRRAGEGLPASLRSEVACVETLRRLALGGNGSQVRSPADAAKRTTRSSGSGVCCATEADAALLARTQEEHSRWSLGGAPCPTCRASPVAAKKSR
jgi:hypothetical protein